MSGGRRRNHHTVPQLLLRNFVDASGDLFEFDLHTLKRSKRKPAQVAHSTDFYTVETNSGPSDLFEVLLSKFEDAAAPALRRVVNCTGRIDASDLDLLIPLLALQKLRTPVHRDGISDFTVEAESMAHHMALSAGLDPEESTKQVRAELEGARSGNFLNPLMIETLTPVYRLMRRRGWAVLHRSKDGPSFVIGDNPLAIADLRPDTGPPYFPLIPFGEDSRITMPLSPDCMLISYFEDTMAHAAMIPSELVGMFNYEQMKHAGRRVYGCEGSFLWGTIGDRRYFWADYVEDQKQVRQETGWRPPGFGR